MEKGKEVICKVDDYFAVEEVFEQLDYKVVEQTLSDDGKNYTYVVVKD